MGRRLTSALRSVLPIAAIIVALTASTPVLADKIETAGEILRVALPVTAGAYSLYLHDYDGTVQLVVSEVISEGLSFGLSHLIREQRPNGADWHSFPSDSAAVAFSAATYLQIRYGWNYGIPAYALAAFVGYSRVELQQHHWGDVIAGAAIGWGASELTTVRYNNYAITAYPGFEGHPLGITLVARWSSGIITSKTSQGHPSMTWRVMGIAKLPGFLPTLSYQPTTLQNVLAAVATARAKREGIAVAARCLLLARPRQCLAQHWSAVQRIAALTRLDIDTLSDEFKVLSLNEPRNDVTLRFDAEPQLALSIRGNTEIADGLLCLRDVSRHSISTVPGTSHAASPISLPMGDSSS